MCPELFHAPEEEAEWTESRVVTLIDTLPPGSPWRANQGWIGGARSQAQVWCLFSSFSVIALRQSVLAARPRQANPGRARSTVSPTVACRESPAWGWEEGAGSEALPPSLDHLRSEALCPEHSPSMFPKPACAYGSRVREIQPARMASLSFPSHRPSPSGTGRQAGRQAVGLCLQWGCLPCSHLACPPHPEKGRKAGNGSCSWRKQVCVPSPHLKEAQQHKLT